MSDGIIATDLYTTMEKINLNRREKSDSKPTEIPVVDRIKPLGESPEDRVTLLAGIIQTPYELRMKTSDQPPKDFVCFSGYAIFNYASQSDDAVSNYNAQILAGPQWRNIDAVVPSVAPAAIASQAAFNPLWAVDRVNYALYNGQILIQADVAVRGLSSFLIRLVYHVNALGILL